jgi:phosphopantetheinyl transferase (holo-ACP synthase)
MPVGIDLLEIERMEQALDRGAGLALLGPPASLGVAVDISLTHSKVTAAALVR